MHAVAHPADSTGTGRAMAVTIRRNQYSVRVMFTQFWGDGPQNSSVRKIFLVLTVLAIALSSAAVGLHLSPYLAVRLGFAPFRQTIVEGEEIPNALIELINSAQSSVVVSAEVIDNLPVLLALVEAGKRNVAVGVVLSGPNRASDGAFRWLTEKGIPVRKTTTSLRGSIVVIDQSTAATSSSSLLAKSALGKEQSAMFVFSHKPTAVSFFELVKKQGGK